MRRLLVVLAAATFTVMAGAAALAQGTLRVAVSSNANTLDPAKTKIGEEYIINFLVFSGLTEIDASGKVKPDLAESWSASEDQKSWTFNLRPGVKFHNGREVEADDVKVTIERVMDKATGSTARVNFDIVEGIQIVDKHTIRFNLKQPYSGFAEIFGDRQVRIIPRDQLDTLASQPIGSGAFKLIAFKPGDRFELAKNPDYYKPDEPKLDNVLIRIIPERAAQFAALEAGEIDLIWDVPPEVLDQYKNSKNVQLDSVPSSSWDGLIMNAAQKPFDDMRVRQAVHMPI